MQLCKERAASDPVEREVTKDVRYQEFREVTPDCCERTTQRSGVTSFLSMTLHEERFFMPCGGICQRTGFTNCSPFVHETFTTMGYSVLAAAKELFSLISPLPKQTKPPCMFGARRLCASGGASGKRSLPGASQRVAPYGASLTPAGTRPSPRLRPDPHPRRAPRPTRNPPRNPSRRGCSAAPGGSHSLIL